LLPTHRDLLYLLFFVFLVALTSNSNGQETPEGQIDTTATTQVGELLDVALENALSFRNYEYTIDKSTLFDPVEKNTKAKPFLSVFQMRMVMDWDKERCIVMQHSYRESPETDTKSDESFSLEKFENGVRTTKVPRYISRPKVENLDFHRFLKESSIPMVELVGLRMFPANFTLPYDQSIAKAKEPMKSMRFRYLPDGTGVRTVQQRMGTSTTRWSPTTLMPTEIGSVFTTNHPPISQRVTYETEKGVHRPKEITLDEATFFTDENTKADGSNIQYMTGTGTIGYNWKSFNVENPDWPDDSTLTTDKATWIQFLGIE
jgi:hypothetical protein